MNELNVACQMPKLYFQGLTYVATPPKNCLKSWYTRDAKKARTSGALGTWQEAELTRHLCEQEGYSFPTNGDRHVCVGFKIEERTGKFVVFCEAPFSIDEDEAGKS